MNSYSIKVLKKLRQIYHHLFQQEDDIRGHSLPIHFEGQAASDEIKKLLATGKPAMICRFGSSELNGTLTHYYRSRDKSALYNSINFIRGNIREFWWDDHIVNAMTNNAGFFPTDIDLLEKYGKRMIEDIKEIDILGSWLKDEQILEYYFKNATRVKLQDLEPYYHKHPWSSILEGKKVLVIHPFEESIQSQFKKRDKLFPNPETLPPFELKTIKAIQSIAFNESPYKNWFEALKGMSNQIDHTDFDIAIIGCGAYGLPLAAHVKRQGKQAIHLGGATQILFGVKGKRWEDSPFFKTIFNEHWASPRETETPKNHSNVEEGCYW